MRSKSFYNLMIGPRKRLVLPADFLSDINVSGTIYTGKTLLLRKFKIIKEYLVCLKCDFL